MAAERTELRERNFGIDLPGDWEQMPDDEPDALVFRDLGSDRKLSVLLLGVKPLFAIADQERLVEDYISHRSKYEAGQRTGLGPVTGSWHRPEADDILGGWSVVDMETGTRIRHHLILTGRLLADFRYEAGLDEETFDAETAAVFASATARAE